MNEIYDNIIQSEIGRVQATVSVSNSFPVKGEPVVLTAKTKWAQSDIFNTTDGIDRAITENSEIVNQSDSISITTKKAGELIQAFSAQNFKTSKTLEKILYVMEPQTHPYFDLSVSKEVIRCNGEITKVKIKGENGYSLSRPHSAIVRVFKENETESPIFTFTDLNNIVVENAIEVDLSFTKSDDRGIYDIEVDLTDTEKGVTLTKHIKKLVSVTPALCPKPFTTELGYEVVSTYTSRTSYSPEKDVVFELKLWRNVCDGLSYAEAIIPSGNNDSSKYNDIPISLLPEGVTLVFRKDPLEPSEYPQRWLMIGGKDNSLSAETGTPNFTYEKPLVITHDSTEQYQLRWRSYGAFMLGWNIRNIVIDGRGYHNIDKGIRLTPWSSKEKAESGIWLNNGTSDVELFDIEVDGADFAGVFAKTDPDPNRPWYWRGNGFEFKNMLMHHCIFKNTGGEGNYLGYFDSAPITKPNKSGVNVTYQAHLQRRLRIYRNVYYQTGYDAFQCNNAFDVEVCYCDFIKSAYRQEVNQGSVFSCTLDGKIYNNKISENYGPIGVIGPMKDKLEFFNNILTSGKGSLGFSYYIDKGHHNLDPDKNGVNNTTEYLLYNNIITGNQIFKSTGSLQFNKFRMYDNLIISETSGPPVIAPFTGDGNMFITGGYFNWEEMDSQLKIADSSNYNFQPACDSNLTTGGKMGMFQYDIRGYKNWFKSQLRIGPYMGIYINPEVNDDALFLSQVKINNGDLFTYNPTIQINTVYSGVATDIKVGIMPDLSDSSWQTLSESISYLIDRSYGEYAVYVQLRNQNEVSKIVSSSIEYRKEPLGMVMQINEGGNISTSMEVKITLFVSGVFEGEIQYMLSESSTFNEVVWRNLVGNEVLYTFDSKGPKKLYAKIKSIDGQEVLDTADIVISNEKCIISLGWLWNTVGFDEANGINKLDNSNKIERVIKNVSNVLFGKARSEYGKVLPDMNGNITGNNSGIYPDTYLKINSVFGQKSTDDIKSSNVYFTKIKNGTYTVRLYANGKKTNSALNSFYSVNGAEILAADYVNTLEDNFNNKFIFENVIVSDGSITIRYRGDAQYNFVPLNVIEIEEQ